MTAVCTAGGKHCRSNHGTGIVKPRYCLFASGNVTCAKDDNGTHCWGDVGTGYNSLAAFLVKDNCPLMNNVDQKDVDGDGVGGALIPILTVTALLMLDNCPSVANADRS
ncbi:MAG: hypothetical protein R3E67_08980 [Pseudomonadales bacterium]